MIAPISQLVARWNINSCFTVELYKTGLPRSSWGTKLSTDGSVWDLSACTVVEKDT